MKKPSFDNVWVVRGVALLFTLLLYVFVTSGNNQQFQSASNQQFASVDSSETISNVPVFLGEHDDDLYISGLPDTVAIRLTGPRNLISQLSIDNFRVETEDLTNLPTGSRAIRLLAVGLPEDINYEISPSQVIVRLSRKATITVPVEYEIVDGTIAEGYEVSHVTMDPSEVELTGDSAKIENVKQAIIRIVSEEPMSESFSAQFRLQILDEDDNLLDVNTSTGEIQVDIEVVPQRVNIPLRISPRGENLQTFSYNYSFADANQVEIVAEPDLVNQLGVLDVVVDVSGLTETAIVTGVINVPENIRSISQSEVAIEVDIQQILGERITPIQQVNSSENSSATDESVEESHSQAEDLTTNESNESQVSSDEPS
ncbi:CdaR family protein [Fundicoccus culcitae]|uniref:CdaR family protein n=1 Tax=Fundicoccus culcitae TaxID=2969821 RepID=A0ABY5P317_9LACT|nr:CdaR family protein [Fundicoccus culcitae]UUX32986.1 CdaR family protein [Fundicoccus culcitae]